MASIVCTQNMAVGFNLYLGSQSICIVGFGFPTMGGPMLETQVHSFFLKPFSLPHRVAPLLS